MRCSLEHLKSFLNLTPKEKAELTADRLGAVLTQGGLEFAGATPVAKEFSVKEVVVGKIVAASPHPNADKLQVCQVVISEAARKAFEKNPEQCVLDEVLTIVCGAKNARVGLYVAVAKVGAVLPGDFKIKPAKLRGVESFGMLCSKVELGLAEISEGIWELPDDLPLGASIWDVFQLGDSIVEFDLTPNRGDCASVLGLARDFSALTGIGLDLKEITSGACTNTNANTSEQNDLVIKKIKIEIEIESPADCGCYFGAVLSGVNLKAVTPVWMSERLERAGYRLIHPAVDITNYVMLTLGQPMHAFDLNKLRGNNIQIRRANPGEKIKLLDEREIVFQKVEGRSFLPLVIADAVEPIALAGVMGGLDSAISEETVDIFLESAHFRPMAVSGVARSYGLHTEASYRFERGVDPVLPEQALNLAVIYFKEILGAKFEGVTAAGDLGKNLDKERKKSSTELRLSKIEKLLGESFSEEEVMSYCKKLGGVIDKIKNCHEVVFQVQAPSYRFDLNIEADWIEELARLKGLDHLAPTLPESLPGSLVSNESKRSVRWIKNYFQSRGYHEAITYSFISPKLHHLFFDSKLENLENLENLEHRPEVLLNPISEELSVMRMSLLPGLLAAAQHNLLRQANSVRLFEVGRVFVHKKEITKIAGVLAGQYAETNPHEMREINFYDLKADIEALLIDGAHSELKFEPFFSEISSEISSKRAERVPGFLHPGRAANILREGVKIGYIGQIHPSIQKALDLRVAPYIFECCLEEVLRKRVPECCLISKFPSISRDLALVLDRGLPAADIISEVKKLGGVCLTDVQVFDLYMGDKIQPGKKSLALNLILQSLSNTLKEEEVQQIVQNILQGLNHRWGITLR